MVYNFFTNLFIKKNIVFLVLYLFIFFINIVLSLKEMNMCILTDCSFHAKIASNISLSDPLGVFSILSYPGWHYLVKLLSVFLPFSKIIFSAAIANGVFAVFTAVVVKYILDKDLKNIDNIIKIVCIIVFTFVTPIYLPFFNKAVCLGQGSPNIWYNPTFNAVKPFGIFIFYFFIKVYNNYGEKSLESLKNNSFIKNLILLSFLMLISSIMKPIFVQVFIPAIVIFIIIKMIKTKFKYWKNCFLLMLCFVPVVILSVIQLLLIFNFGDKSIIANNNGVVISFFKIWRMYSPCILISIIITIAFPAYIYILRFKTIFTNNYFLIALILILVGFAQSSFISETGSRMKDGNFMWGYFLSLSIVWLVTLISFIQYILEHKTKNYLLKYIGYILVILHFISGVYYYISLVITPLEF